MPGRGVPWRGVGKGVPNRIGTNAIADGSIQESDLNTALQDKVNAGGGIDHFAQSELLDDFFYNEPDAVSFYLNLAKYTTKVANAQIAIQESQAGFPFGVDGVINVEISSVASGDGGGFCSSFLGGGNNFDPKKNITMRIRTALVAPLTTRVDLIGLIDDNAGSTGVTGTVNFTNSVDGGFWFESENGGNWFAVSNDASIDTKTDTGVAPVAGVFQNFEVIHTPTSPRQDIFKIDGSTVATHTTNVDNGTSNPNRRFFLTNWIAVLAIGDDRSHELDLWHVVADR